MILFVMELNFHLELLETPGLSPTITGLDSGYLLLNDLIGLFNPLAAPAWHLCCGIYGNFPPR